MALIPSFYPNCVVAIGRDGASGSVEWMGTGFLYAYHIGDDAEGKPQYNGFLVTNRHVLEGESRIYVRFNPQVAAEPAKQDGLDLTNAAGGRVWFGHPDPEIDVAVVPAAIPTLQERAYDIGVFQSDQHAATIDKLAEEGISEGDLVYVLGFPMGMVGEGRSYVIVRSGSIARIRDAIVKANREFLVDVTVFPGNSGGPVILRPEAISIGGKTPSRAYLIGIVKQYVAYEEEAVSRQTGETRIIFQENSGLAAAHPVDFIDETIRAFLAAHAAKP